jgi:TRAP-type C4-dicarboxylate transport system permease small subunit
VVSRALRLAEGLQALVAGVARWLAYASAAGTFLIVALLVTSSMKRYLFQQPIHVTEELGGLLFLGTTFFGLVYGFTQNRHVRLELFWRLLPHPWQELMEVLGYVLCIAALALLIQQTWATTVFSYEIQGRSVMTEILLWPWRLIIPAVLLLLAIAIFARSLVVVLRLIDRALSKSQSKSAS